MGINRLTSLREAQKLHRESMRQRLFTRMAAAKARGDQALLAQLEAEQKALRLW